MDVAFIRKCVSQYTNIDDVDDDHILFYDGELGHSEAFLQSIYTRRDIIFYRFSKLPKYKKRNGGVFELVLDGLYDVLYKIYIPSVKELEYIMLYKNNKPIVTLHNTNVIEFTNLFPLSSIINGIYKIEYKLNGVSLSSQKRDEGNKEHINKIYRPQMLIGIFNHDIRTSFNNEIFTKMLAGDAKIPVGDAKGTIFNINLNIENTDQKQCCNDCDEIMA
jgi:hypothetical protein